MASNDPSDLRERVYSTYVSNFKDPTGARLTAEVYDADARSIASRLTGWLPARRDAAILDVGCGPGNVLYYLEREGYTNLTGVDLSEEQIAQANAMVRTATLVAGDMNLLLETEAQYDLIIGLDIIEHFTRQEAFGLVERFARALKPGGRLILQTPNAESPWASNYRYSDLTHETMFSPRSLDYLLRTQGFVDFEVRESGPYVHGLKSAVRWGLWEAIRAGLKVWNLAETGSTGSGCYTRVMMATAVKGANA